MARKTTTPKTGAASGGAEGTAKPETTPRAPSSKAKPKTIQGVEDAKVISETPPPGGKAAASSSAPETGKAADSAPKPDPAAPAPGKAAAPAQAKTTAKPDPAAPKAGDEDGGTATGATKAASTGSADGAKATGPAATDAAKPSTSEAKAKATDTGAAKTTEGEGASAKPAPPPARAPEPARRSPWPLVLGGIVAGAIGFGAAYLLPDDTALRLSEAEAASQEALSAQTDRIDALTAQVAALAEELGTTRDALTKAQADRDAAQDAAQREGAQTVAAQVDQIDGRLAELEARPIIDLSSLDNSEAFETALDELRREVETLSQETQNQIASAREASETQIQAAREAAEARIQAATEEANALEERAAAEAQRAAERAALSRVLAAIDAGTAFDAPLANFREVSDTEVPDVLERNAGGVATLAQLQTDFAPAAREALRAARRANAGGEGTVANFLKNQFGVRALEAREGDGVEAVLARMQSDMTGGNLQAALAEAEALPGEAANALSTWRGTAQARLDTLAAAQSLTQDLTTN
ncbi:MAG: hypothetical protein ACU0CO_04610 [Shimia sp.]